LVDVLELFEWVSNELQTNKVSISRVYPSIISLKEDLLFDIESYRFTQDLRKALHKSLVKRFDNLFLDDDLYVIATFLDPNHGLNAFPDEMKAKVRRCVKKVMLVKATPVIADKKPHKKKVERNNKYKKFPSSQPISIPVQLDNQDIVLDSYLGALETNQLVCPLYFWKKNEFVYPELAELAKKYLSVPASSCVERMFSIAGHIFSFKRRRLGIQVFSDLVTK
jgi:hypothetical protein